MLSRAHIGIVKKYDFVSSQRAFQVVSEERSGVCSSAQMVLEITKQSN